MHDAYRFALDAWDVRHLILLVPILAAILVGYAFWLRRWFDKRYRRHEK